MARTSIEGDYNSKASLQHGCLTAKLLISVQQNDFGFPALSHKTDPSAALPSSQYHRRAMRQVLTEHFMGRETCACYEHA
eukprot:352821-Chlamydomonas_euryale.AAC.2